MNISAVNNINGMYSATATNIAGKIISLEGKNGVLRLTDGTLLNVNLTNDDNLPLNKLINFKITEFNDGIMYLTPTNISQTSSMEAKNIYQQYLDRISLPYEYGKKIIDSLIKFNQPLTEENIMKLYNDILSINKFIDLNEEDIYSTIQKYSNEEINKNILSTAKDVISQLKDVDTDFMSFLIENYMGEGVENILKVKDFIDKEFTLNDAIKIIKELNMDEESPAFQTLKEADLKIDEKIKQKLLENMPLKDLESNLEVLKNLKDNYTIVYFNTTYSDKVYKNKILIKNRHKGIKNFDNVKFFISLDTSKMNTVEVYINKTMSQLSIILKSEKQFIPTLNKRLNELKAGLESRNFTIGNIRVEKYEKKSNIIELASFFNERSLKGVDVKI